MQKVEYDLSLSNENITRNRMDELNHFMQYYYNDQYQQALHYYKIGNPIFLILGFLAIPFQAFTLNASLLYGIIATIVIFVVMISLYVYMDQKPRAVVKNIFTNIYENHKYIVTDIEYELLSTPVTYNNKDMFYYQFATRFTNNQRLLIDSTIVHAQLDKSREKAPYEEVIKYLNQLPGGQHGNS